MCNIFLYTQMKYKSITVYIENKMFIKDITNR